MSAALFVYDDATRFLDETGAFLKSSPAGNSMIAMPAARVVRAPNEDDAGIYFAAVKIDGEVVAVACHGNSGGTLMSAAPDEAVSLIAHDMAARGRRPDSVVAPLRECETFAGVWSDLTGAGWSRRFHLRQFELTSVPAARISPGRLRAPDPDECVRIVAWQLAFIDEAGLPEAPQRIQRNLERRIARGLIRVWDAAAPQAGDARDMVAFSGFNTNEDTARIAPVYTPPPLRGRGYATAMVTELARELFAMGKKAIYLTTDVANPTSNGIYQRIGFRPVVDHFHFDLAYPDA
jgi:RimJ/RimL family protein N-acetyltransferase